MVDSDSVETNVDTENLLGADLALQAGFQAFMGEPLPVWCRMAALDAAAVAMEQAPEPWAREIATEGIKTITEARREVARAARTLRLASDESRRLCGKTIAFDQVPAAADRFGWSEPMPLGLVVGVTPFNDPLNLVAHKVGPALAAGAPIIIKPHPSTPGPARRLAALLNQGLPAGWVQVVEGGPATARRLAGDHRTRVISFTGGRSAGADIAAVAASKRVILELGGSCAAYVAPDADVADAARRLVAGCFAAAGQNCVHTQRIYVAAPLFDALTAALIPLAQSVRLGPQLDETSAMGPLITETHAKRLEAQVADAVQRGAVILTGGERSGRTVQPTLMTRVPHDHSLVLDETFGPITVIAAVESDDDAIFRMNAAGPMINAALFTGQMARIRRFQRAIQAGALIVNDSTDFRIDAMPFGGDGAAGLGREGVRSAVLAMTELRVICIRP